MFFLSFPASLAMGVDLTFSEAINRVWQDAPLLKASEAAVEEGTIRVRQASRWRNPTVSFEAENFGSHGTEFGSDRAEYTATIEQPLEIGGRRKTRTRLAQVALDEARLGQALAVMELRAEVARRFVRLLHAQAMNELAQERWTLTRRTAEVVQAQQNSGAAAGIDQARFEVPVSLAEVERDRTAAAVARAQDSLASLWGGFGEDPVRAVGELTTLPIDPGIENLAASLENSPVLRLARLPVEVRREALRLAKTSRWPELSAVLGHRWFEEDSTDAWVAGVAVSLPLWDHPKDAIRLAQAAQRRAEASTRLAERRWRDEARSIMSRFSAARRAAQQLSDEAISRARESLALVSEGYELGRYDLLFLLDAQKTLFELRAQYLDTLLECHLARADLDAMVDLAVSSF